jgi:hypothetical protein
MYSLHSLYSNERFFYSVRLSRTFKGRSGAWGLLTSSGANRRRRSTLGYASKRSSKDRTTLSSYILLSNTKWAVASEFLCFSARSIFSRTFMYFLGSLWFTVEFVRLIVYLHLAYPMCAVVTRIVTPCEFPILIIGEIIFVWAFKRLKHQCRSGSLPRPFTVYMVVSFIL